MTVLKIAAAAAALALCAGSAQAAVNLGFESGVTGWTTSGDAGALGANGVFAPQEGVLFGYVAGGQADVYSTLSQTFSLAAGQTISGKVGFKAQDYAPYYDDAYLKIGDLVLFTANVGSVGDYGSTGWQDFSFTAKAAGDYVLQLGAANRLDGSMSSYAVIDQVGLSAVPEPATWAMMIVGFGAVGSMARSARRQRALAFV